MLRSKDWRYYKMAKDKKSFVLYTDLIYTIEKLPDDKAGLLFKHLLKYVNDQDPITDDLIVEIAFEPIKHQLKRDLLKYEDKREQWSEAGKASAEARRLKKVNEAERNPTDVKSVSTVSTVTVNVTDTVNVTVKNNIDDRKLKFADTLKPFLSTYGRDMLSDFYKYWTEPNKSGSKFKQEMQKTWDVSRRLETWSRNDFNKKKPDQKQELVQQTIKLGER